MRPVLHAEVVCPHLEVRQGDCEIIKADDIVLVLIRVFHDRGEDRCGFLFPAQGGLGQCLEEEDISALVVVVFGTGELRLAFKGQDVFFLSTCVVPSTFQHTPL